MVEVGSTITSESVSEGSQSTDELTGETQTTAELSEALPWQRPMGEEAVEGL